MKNLLLIPALLAAASIYAQNGYEIKVTLKPFKNQYIYLGHYSGKQYPVVDSVKLNEKSEGVFKGSQKLGGGIYIVVFPTRDKFFEILIDKQQRFSVMTDAADITKKTFVNSPDNVHFEKYQKYMNVKGRQIDSVKSTLKYAKSAADSLPGNQFIQAQNREISQFRRQLIQENPQSILAVLLRLTEEPQVPPGDKHPGGKYDSVYAYHYFKNHYWDNINFWDDRISRTPAALFEERLDKYFNTLVAPAADSVIREIDWMLGYASVSKELTRFLLVKFITRYMNLQYMWEDAVYVHLFEKYFANKPYDWLTEGGKKMITDRAYSLMANIMGHPAENISLPDTSGVVRTLYEDTASRFTLVCFWDPTCGHCKETLPVLDSMYRLKWRALGLKMYTVAKETEGTRKDWLEFIRQHHIGDWTNVFYSKQEEMSRINANIPSYSQLYDVQTFPTLFLLDKKKQIIAKKLTWQQADEILAIRSKQN